MTRDELISALQAMPIRAHVVFRFVDDEEGIDDDCPVEFVYEEDGEIHLSDTDPEEGDGDEEDENIIEGEIVNG